MPSPLEALQRRFVRSVTFAPDADFVAGVRGGGTLSPAEAVEVYRRGYPARLTEALGETYELCWRVLGDEDFFAVSRDFIARAPSLSHNLSDYGAHFPEFLANRKELSHAPFLKDLARLEWEFKELFHAPAHRGLTPAELAAAAKPGSRLVLGSAVRLLSFAHRVHAIWRRDLSDDSALERADWEGEESVILYKQGGATVYSRVLSAPEHAALAGLAAGRPLDEALAAAEGLDQSGASALFSFVAESGLVAELR